MAILTFYATTQKSIFKSKQCIYYDFNTLGTFGLDLKKTTKDSISYDYKISFTIDAKKYQKAYQVLQMAIFLKYPCLDNAAYLKLTSKIATAAGLKVPNHFSISAHPEAYLIALQTLNEKIIQYPHARDERIYRPSVA